MRNTTPLVSRLLIRKAQEQREEVREKVGMMYRMSNNARKVSMTTGHRSHNYTLHSTVHCRTVDSVLLYIGITAAARCIQVYSAIKNTVRYYPLQPGVSHRRLESRPVLVLAYCSLRTAALDSTQSTVRVRTVYCSLRTAALDSPQSTVHVRTIPAQQQHLKTSIKNQHGGKTLQHNNQPFKPTQFTPTHQQ